MELPRTPDGGRKKEVSAIAVTGRAFGEFQKLKPGASELFICIAMGLIVTQQTGETPRRLFLFRSATNL
jgi:hypothetical protein